MGRQEARRLGLIQAALAGKISSREGAEALGLGVRQFKRLRARVLRAGPAAVVHGNRGRPSPRRLGERVVEAIQDLLTQRLARLNDCHLAELLADRGLAVSAASVRRVRLRLGLAAKHRRRPPQHRRRRLRAARAGAWVQIDGSPFAWWSDRAPPYHSIGAIDDATGRILALTLQPSEDLHGYTTMLRQLILAHGLPLKLHGDRTSVLVRNDDSWTLDEQLQGGQEPTHVGHMLRELGIRYEAAHSPQAKGRIERLWGTLQDRLAAEMRLARVATLEQAEAFLPAFIERYNQRFAIPAREARSAFRPAPRDLDRILACCYPRVVAKDDTVTVPGRWIQLPPGPHRRSWHKSRVEVRELLDGRMLVIHPRHGVLAEQPPLPGSFRLVGRHGGALRRTLVRDPKPPRPTLALATQAPRERRPQAKPKPSSPWRRSYKSVFRFHSLDQGVSESLTS